jgi:hypothetical protein
VQDLDPKATLDDLGDDLAFLNARLAADPRTLTLSPAIAALLEQTDAVGLDYRQRRRAITLADAVVATARELLETEVGAFGKTVLVTANLDRNSPQFRAWFELEIPVVLAKPRVSAELAGRGRIQRKRCAARLQEGVDARRAWAREAGTVGYGALQFLGACRR